MRAAPLKFGCYLAFLQFLFTLCWVIYAIYLPKLAANAGIGPDAIFLMLMLDQAIFTICDFTTGIFADKVTATLGRIGAWVAAATALSCLAFLALPFIASAGAPVFLGVTAIWAVTSSALRAPPWMLLGKYTAKPSLPWLSSLALFGYSITAAIAPFLGVTLREIDPRIPFALSSVALVLTTLGMIWAERMLVKDGKPTPAPPRAFSSFSAPAAGFALAVIVLALGYQLHFALDSAPLYLRFADATDLPWLMPVFVIGFNIAMVPASLITKRVGGYAVMGAAGLMGALAILAAHYAQALNFLVAAQFTAGAAWGAILMSAFMVAFAIGENGGEGRMTGLLFSALALAAFARLAAVATGLGGHPALKAVLQWTPTACWALAGATLFYLAITGLRRWSAGTQRHAS